MAIELLLDLRQRIFQAAGAIEQHDTVGLLDTAIELALDEMAREEGFLLCPEGAATYAAYKQSLADGRVKKTDRVVLFNCASGLKYPLPKIEKKLDRNKPIDYAAL